MDQNTEKLGLFYIPKHLLVTTPQRLNPKDIEPHSHFSKPIPSGLLHGRSRRWGDAPLITQLVAANTVLSEAKRQNLSPLHTAFALATVRNESGFNPDAAATSTSAAGLGQFINETGKYYGLNAENRFSILENAKATISHIKDLLSYQKQQNRQQSEKEALINLYALYHDGPSLQYGGKEIAEKKVLPWVPKFNAWLQQ